MERKTIHANCSGCGVCRQVCVLEKFRALNPAKSLLRIEGRFPSPGDYRVHGDGPIDQVTPEQISNFLNRLTYDNKPYNKGIRHSQISSFFNFVRNNIDPVPRNPSDKAMIRKLYRERVPWRWKIIEK